MNFLRSYSFNSKEFYKKENSYLKGILLLKYNHTIEYCPVPVAAIFHFIRLLVVEFYDDSFF